MTSDAIVSAVLATPTIGGEQDVICRQAPDVEGIPQGLCFAGRPQSEHPPLASPVSALDG